MRSLPLLTVLYLLASTTPAVVSAAGTFIPRQLETGAPGSSLHFIENLGQWPEPIRFLAERAGVRVRAECNAIGIEASADASGAAGGQYWSLVFEGCSGTSTLEGCLRQPGIHSYFVGNDPTHWRTRAQSYAMLRWRDLYPGIDVLLRQGAEQLEYDIQVAPYAELGQIALRCEGSSKQAESSPGVVSLDGGRGELLHVPGRCFQYEPDGTEKELGCQWWLDEQGLLRVRVPERDPALTLLIDPELLWSTYLGGISAERASSVTWDAQNNVTVAGITIAYGFPQSPGTYQSPQGDVNAFVTRFDRNGQLVFSSVFGGGAPSIGAEVDDVAVAANGETVVVGHTAASDFPVTAGAFDTVKNTYNSVYAGFVTRLTASGDALIYSTFLEGRNNPQSGAGFLQVVTDSEGRAVVGGGGVNSDFPVTTGTLQASYGGGGGDAFLLRMNSTGSALDWCTFLGGNVTESVYDLAIDVQDRISVVGATNSTNFPTTPGAWKSMLGTASANMFVCRVNDEGSSFLWSTYLGGHTLGRSDYPKGVAVTQTGDVIVSGYTDSLTYPVTPGAFQTQWGPGPIQGFVTRVRDGKTLVASTFLTDPSGHGGCGNVRVDSSGVVTVSGGGSCGFPITAGSWDNDCGGTPESAIVRLSPGLSRLFYSSFLGGAGQDSADFMAMTPTGRVAMAGQSVYTSQNWPVTADAFQPSFGGGARDAVVTVLDLLFQGVASFGLSLPGCKGPLVANTTEMPLQGSWNFSLYCSGAPQNASGLLMLGFPAQSIQPSGSSPDGIHPLYYVLVPAQSDAEGFTEVSLPLPQNSAGLVFTARFVFPSRPFCPARASVSTSNSLRITIQ